jgi:hypothetical protein
MYSCTDCYFCNYHNIKEPCVNCAPNRGLKKIWMSIKPSKFITKEENILKEKLRIICEEI